MKLFKRKMSKKLKTAIHALADGIECGAKLRPQCIGSLMKCVGSEAGTLVYGSCALGAAAECKIRAIVQDMPEATLKAKVQGITKYSDILAMYGVQDRSADRTIAVEGDFNIVSNGEPDAISTLIYRLNDQREWTREQIAAFLRDLD